MTWPPRFVYVFTAAALLCLVAVLAVAWTFSEFTDTEEGRDCARAIASRDDSRAMWLYLIDTSTADPQRVATFAKKLDELLPALKCVDGNWVPDQANAWPG